MLRTTLPTFVYTDLLKGREGGWVNPNYLAGPFSFSALMVVSGAAVVVVDVIESAFLQDVVVHGRSFAEVCFIAG